MNKSKLFMKETGQFIFRTILFPVVCIRKSCKFNGLIIVRPCTRRNRKAFLMKCKNDRQRDHTKNNGRRPGQIPAAC